VQKWDAMVREKKTHEQKMAKFFSAIGNVWLTAALLCLFDGQNEKGLIFCAVAYYCEIKKQLYRIEDKQNGNN
jgi:hypothetical protein